MGKVIRGTARQPQLLWTLFALHPTERLRCGILAPASEAGIGLLPLRAFELLNWLTIAFLGWDEGVPQMSLGEKAILRITRYSIAILPLPSVCSAGSLSSQPLRIFADMCIATSDMANGARSLPTLASTISADKGDPC